MQHSVNHQSRWTAHHTRAALAATRSVRAAAAFGSFLPRFLMQGQQGSSVAEGKLARTEVTLHNSNTAHTHPFRVCTFNVLADGLAQSGDFVKVPISCLQWEHRLPLILQEVREADADIICLQELNHFDVLAQNLLPQGYSCFFRAKKPSPALKFGFPADGIALFYRHSRFSCSPAPAGHCFESMDGQPAAQGFVTALLQDKLSQRHVLVAVTHLKAKAGADNEQTRVHQVRQLLQEVEHMQERHMQLQQQQQQPDTSSSNGASKWAAPQPAAVLLCGDFNTTPDSDTVQALKAHELGLHSIWDVAWATPGSNGSNGKHSSGTGSFKAVKPTNGTSSGSGSAGAEGSNSSGKGVTLGGNGKHASTTQQSDASSAAVAAAGPADGGGSSRESPQQPPVATAAAAAAASEGQQQQPAQEGCEFTTWKFRSNGVAKRTIDYIWYTGQQLVPVSRWRMLSEAEIGPAGLPNTRYPSDHMAVTCQFGWVEGEGGDGEL